MAKYKILLVDDEENILNSLKRTLHDEKYEIIVEKTAEKAAVVINKEKIDLIICDYKLSGMNGIDFLEKVSKNNPEIITILLTGKADMQVAMDAINRSSVYMFIMKPWDNEMLVSSVSRVLEQRDLAVENRNLMHAGLKNILARDIMSRFAITIKEDSSLLNAAHLMMRFKISGLPVISQESKISGIITASDLFRMMGEIVVHDVIVQNSLYKGNIMVKDVMTKDVVTVEKTTTFFDIVNTMYGKNIHTLPVVENNEIAGIIGRRDVINSFYKLLKTTSVS